MPDKNFDELHDRFEKNIYQNIKGEVRSQVIQHHVDLHLPELKHNGLSCADVGAGFGQFSAYLAQRGHHVDYFEISEKMTTSAKRQIDAALHPHIRFHCGAFQQNLVERYDFINCQAVLEWLDDADNALMALADHLKPNGVLLLLFYNQNSIKMRNLILGNLNAAHTSGSTNSGGLTPPKPQHIDTVFAKLTALNFSIDHWFGVRCFTDYQHRSVRNRLGVKALVEHEIPLSVQDPFRAMARYIGVIARRNTSPH